MRRFRVTDLKHDYCNYINLRKTFKSLCLHKKIAYQNSERNKLVSARNNPKTFWSILKQNIGTVNQISNINAADWMGYFKNLLCKSNQPSLSNFVFEMNVEDDSSYILNSPIHIDEIYQSINRLKPGKAQGTDGIVAEFYKNTCLYIAPILCSLFNHIFSSGTFPDMWRNSIIVPIHKTGARNDPSNYRGISLLNVMYKIFSNIIYDRLCKWSEIYNILDETQAGFRSGYSTTDNIFSLQSLIQKYISKPGGRFYVLYVDFLKAFDSINHLDLFNCLKRKGLHGNILRILVSMYSEMKCHLRINDKLTESFNCNIGSRQGDVSSTIIFNLYIGELSTLFKDRGHRGIFVNETTPEVLCLLFADDIANCADTAINLQLQINTISEFCNLTGMKVNLGKTQVVVFRNGGPLRSYENWTYNQQPLKVVSVYKYMGLLFSHTLSWGKAHLKLTAQAKKSILAIKTHQKKFGKFSHAEYFKLFDSMVKPILLYGGEIWGVDYIEAVERVQIQFCKDFLGVRSSTNDCMVLGECGRLPLCIYYHLRPIKYWLKLLHMPDHRLPKNCYQMLKSLDEIERVTWVTSIKQLLYRFGFGIVWLSQGVGDPELFLNIFKQRLKDCMQQNWIESINNSTRCESYIHFKTMLNPEKYLYVGLSFSLWKYLARFRCSNHKFKIEIGRHMGIERENRNCTFCLDNYGIICVENEFHAFFNCYQYTNERRRYLYTWYRGPPTLDSFYSLMQNENESIVRKIAIYISAIMKVKENQNTQ